MNSNRSRRIIETKPYITWQILENLFPPELLFSLYPIYLFSGTRIKNVTKDYKYIRVELSLNLFNRNYVGSHFGGSLFAMTDPFYMLMFLKNLGSGYIVWDKKASIEFLKATTEDVYCEFILTDDEITNIKRELELKKSIEKTFYVEVKSKQNDEVIAKVSKTLYFRKLRN